MGSELNTWKWPEEKKYLANLAAVNARVIATRPITCPIADCGRITSVQEYSMHVKVEHPNVPRYEVKINHQQIIEVKLRRMAYGKTYCVAMLFINTSKNQSKEIPFEKYLALPVFVAKLECNFNKETKDQSVPTATATETMDRAAAAKEAFDRHRKATSPPRKSNEQQETENISDLLQIFGACPMGPFGMPPLSKPEKDVNVYQNLDDMVIVWVAGKINDNYRCLLQLIEESGREGHYYNGTLHETKASQISRDVLLTGNHLLIHTSNFQEKPGYKNDIFELSVFILDKQ